jgi:hypothetical protein
MFFSYGKYLSLNELEILLDFVSTKSLYDLYVLFDKKNYAIFGLHHPEVPFGIPPLITHFPFSLTKIRIPFPPVLFFEYVT